MLDFEYNESEAKEAGKNIGYQPIPNGVYRLACVKCDLYQTKGTPKTPSHDALKAEFVVIDGEYAKRRLFVNYICASGNKRADLMAWYKMTGLTGKITEANDFVGSEIIAPVVIEKQKAFGDKPERLVNRVVFTIDDPSKIAKSAAVPTINPNASASGTTKQAVDNNAHW